MVPICKKIRPKSISISRKIINKTYIVWKDHSILAPSGLFLNNTVTIQWGRTSSATLAAYNYTIFSITLPIVYKSKFHGYTCNGYNMTDLTTCYIVNLSSIRIGLVNMVNAEHTDFARWFCIGY